MKPVQYFILGCGGFVGSHLIERLLADPSNKVLGWDLDSSKIQHCMDFSNFDYCDQDVSESGVEFKLDQAVKSADVVINLTAICNPAEYSTRPIDVIDNNFIDAYKVVRACAQHKTWLMYFSTSEVYGRTISSYLPEDNYSDKSLYIQDEGTTPLLMGPVENQRWTYATAKQLMERYVYAHHHDHGMPFTIIRPYNFFGPRMDYIPGVDGEGTPRVLACFMSALMGGEPMQLVDGGNALRTITSIYDVMDIMQLMFEEPEKAQGNIFNIANGDNEVSMRQLAELMRRLYAEITGDSSYLNHPIEDVSAEKFYGEGYEDCDRRVPDMRNLEANFPWKASIPLEDIMRDTMTYYHEHYANKDSHSIKETA